MALFVFLVYAVVILPSIFFRMCPHVVSRICPRVEHMRAHACMCVHVPYVHISTGNDKSPSLNITRKYLSY